MAKYGSPNIKIEVANAGGTLVDLSAHIDTINGFEVEAKIQESTPFGSAWTTQLYSGVRQGNPVTIEGFYDDTATTGPDAILNALGSTRNVKITYGSTKTSSFAAIITKYDRKPVAGESTRFACTLTPTGAVTEA